MRSVTIYLYQLTGQDFIIPRKRKENCHYHVYLDAVEDVVLMFKFFFDGKYKAVFGGILPKKPKPYFSTLCVTATFLGWSLVRDKIL